MDVFTCGVCRKEFNEIEDFMGHKKESPHSFTCSACNSAFHRAEELEEHTKTHEASQQDDEEEEEEDNNNNGEMEVEQHVVTVPAPETVVTEGIQLIYAGEEESQSMTEVSHIVPDMTGSAGGSDGEMPVVVSVEGVDSPHHLHQQQHQEASEPVRFQAEGIFVCKMCSTLSFTKKDSCDHVQTAHGKDVGEDDLEEYMNKLIPFPTSDGGFQLMEEVGKNTSESMEFELKPTENDDGAVHFVLKPKLGGTGGKGKSTPPAVKARKSVQKAKSILNGTVRTPTKSGVWKYFEKHIDGSATCRVCNKVLRTSGNTTNLRTHMHRIHPSLPTDSSPTYKDSFIHRPSNKKLGTPHSTKSAVWKYFIKNPDELSATCNVCHKTLRTSGNTTNLRTHLSHAHPHLPADPIYFRKVVVQKGAAPTVTTIVGNNEDAIATEAIAASLVEESTEVQQGDGTTVLSAIHTPSILRRVVLANGSVKSPGKSRVWKFFDKQPNNTATCRICAKELRTSGNTTNLRNHLHHVHPNFLSEAEPKSALGPCVFSYLSLDFEEETGTAVITLRKPPSNTLSMALVKELSTAIKRLEFTDNCHGFVLTSDVPDIFCGELDANEMRSEKHGLLSDFWNSMQTMWMNLFTTKLATIAAITGHAPSGGCLLAMCCDYRIMSYQHHIGFNDTLLGMAVPTWMQETLTNVVGAREAELALCLGKLYSAEEALMKNMVDEVMEGEMSDLIEKAKEELVKFSKIPCLARQETKKTMREQIAARLNRTREKDTKRFLSFIINECTQKIVTTSSPVTITTVSMAESKDEKQNGEDDGGSS